MLANSILTATAIALAAGLGSASAGERFVPFEGIAAQALGSTEVAVVTPVHWFSYNRKTGAIREINPQFNTTHGIRCYAGGPPSNAGTGEDLPTSIC
jgi:hypothetical protein